MGHNNYGTYRTHSREESIYMGNKYLDGTALTIAIIGAINWGLIGLFRRSPVYHGPLLEGARNYRYQLLYISGRIRAALERICPQMVPVSECDMAAGAAGPGRPAGMVSGKWSPGQYGRTGKADFRCNQAAV